jgi:hypothetical protein
MNKKFYVCIMFVSVMIVFTSCLGTNDENVYYNDTAITAFTLGTLDRTAHTTSYTGGDSTYSTTVTGSNYKMYIDQVNRKIYNLDSLPYGTDIKHVLVTITTKNGGVAAIKNVKSDTLSYYSSSDSIDFTTPRTFFVYSNDGTAYCKYVASVGAHKEEADSFPLGLSERKQRTGCAEEHESCILQRPHLRDGRQWRWSSDDLFHWRKGWKHMETVYS